MFRRSLAALLLAVSASAAQAAPALWTVKDADTTIYLFGTVHALPKDAEWFGGPVREAFEEADTLVLETVAPASEKEVAPVVMSLGFRAGQPPLAQRVPAGERPKLDAAVREAGVPLAALNAMETWLATVMLSAQQLTRLGLDRKLGVEKQLTARARASGKRVTGLETVVEQMSFLDRLPEADQRAFLTATLKQWPEMKTKIDELIARWSSGDVEAMGTEMSQAMRETPKLAKVLLTERNARWADWIKARLAQPGAVFVAVGAGHLAGPDSVQAMLARHGLKAERVK
jgi:uncharacterized protein